VNFVASCFARDQKVEEEERTAEKESNNTSTTKEICFLFLSVASVSLRLKEV
jgi:hypothetical protein